MYVFIFISISSHTYMSLLIWAEKVKIFARKIFTSRTTPFEKWSQKSFLPLKKFLWANRKEKFSAQKFFGLSPNFFRAENFLAPPKFLFCQFCQKLKTPLFRNWFQLLVSHLFIFCIPRPASKVHSEG